MTLCVLIFAATLPAAPLAAATLTAAPLAERAPAEIAAPVRAPLAEQATRVTSGQVTLDFWWVKQLPVKGTELSWSGVEEGTLVGAVRVTGRAATDIRGRAVKPGLYTMRFGLQPQNGDHLGVSPFREFLLISPASVDIDPKPVGDEALVALSKQTIARAHPAMWSLDAPVATAPPLTVTTNAAGHQAMTFEVIAELGGKPVPFRFGLILLGEIEA